MDRCNKWHLDFVLCKGKQKEGIEDNSLLYLWEGLCVQEMESVWGGNNYDHIKQRSVAAGTWCEIALMVR